MTEDYVNYKTAEILKVAGFDWPCEFYYTSEDAPDGAKWLTPSIHGRDDYNSKTYGDYTSAPTSVQAQKWLCVVHKIDLNVCLDDETDDPYVVEIYKDKHCIVGFWELGYFRTYEDCLAAGIAEALKHIKTTENEKER